jgi:homoserine dehydrogenase
MTRVLRGKTLGIVGLGYVGRHVAKIARDTGRTILSEGVMACDVTGIDDVEFGVSTGMSMWRRLTMSPRLSWTGHYAEIRWDAPSTSALSSPEPVTIVVTPTLSGLHHCYARI